MNKIPLTEYKWHQGEGKQYAYKGIALTPVEQRITLLLNELVDEIRAMKKPTSH